MRSTVSGMWSPASVKTRLIPSFCAMRPVRIALPLELDLDIDAGGEEVLHQRVHGLRRPIDDVEHALMRAYFKLLARLLVDMRRAQHGEFLDPCRQRDRAAHPRAGAPGGVDDLAGRLVEHAMIVRPEANAYVLAVHQVFLPLRSRLSPG